MFSSGAFTLGLFAIIGALASINFSLPDIATSPHESLQTDYGSLDYCSQNASTVPDIPAP